MGIEPTLPAWKAGTLPLSYTRGGSPADPAGGAPLAGSAPAGSCRGSASSCLGSSPWLGPCGARRWVVQDSNLRRLSRQIYSLVPLTTWVTTRVEPHPPGPFDSGPSSGKPRSCSRGPRGRAGGESRTHNRRFTKPMLCQLSYASDRQTVKLLTIQTPMRRCKTIPPRASGFHLGPIPIEPGSATEGREDHSGSAGRAGVGSSNGCILYGPEPGPQGWPTIMQEDCNCVSRSA